MHFFYRKLLGGVNSKVSSFNLTRTWIFLAKQAKSKNEIVRSNFSLVTSY